MQINTPEELDSLLADLPLTEEEKQKTRERFKSLKNPEDRLDRFSNEMHHLG